MDSLVKLLSAAKDSFFYAGQDGWWELTMPEAREALEHYMTYILSNLPSSYWCAADAKCASISISLRSKALYSALDGGLAAVHELLRADDNMLLRQLLATNDRAFVRSCLWDAPDSIVSCAIRLARAWGYRCSEAELLGMCAFWQDDRIFGDLDEKALMDIYTNSPANILELYLDRGLPVNHRFWFTMLPHGTKQWQFSPVTALDMCLKKKLKGNVWLLYERGARSTALAARVLCCGGAEGGSTGPWRSLFDVQASTVEWAWACQEVLQVLENERVARMEEELINFV